MSSRPYFDVCSRDTVLVHTAIRNHADQILKLIDSVDENDASFLVYCRLYAEFVHSHHEHEEKLVFPAFAQFGEKMSSLGDELKHEHEELMVNLEALLKVTNEGKPSKETFASVKELTTKVDAFLRPHLKKEEETLCDSEFCKDVTEESMKKLDEDIMKMVRSEPPEGAFPLIVFHLSPQDREAMITKLPWIVAALIFPIWCSKFAAAWKHSPYLTKNFLGFHSAR